MMEEELSRAQFVSAWGSLWCSWCLCTSIISRLQIGLSMNLLYEDVPKLFSASEWDSYCKTLPGYSEYQREIQMRVVYPG